MAFAPGLPPLSPSQERRAAPRTPLGRPLAALIEAEPDSAVSKLDQVLAAAQEVFFEQGYSHAKVEAIAKRARVATATIYAYFPAKADIFHAVISRTLSGYDPVFDALKHTRGGAREKLMAFARTYSALLSAPTVRGLIRVVAAEQPQFPELARAAATQAFRLSGAHLAALIERLHEAGELYAPSPFVAAAQLQGMLEHATLIVGLLHGDEADSTIPLPHLAEQAVKTFLARYARR